MLVSSGAAADTTKEALLFDRPVAVQDLEPVQGPHPAEAVRCHWYADLMIRETRTDSPGTGPSYVVHQGAGHARPVCRAAATGGDTRLDVDNQYLLGRKGAYLVYKTADASGPEPFAVLHLPDGHVLYSDQTSPFLLDGSGGGFKAVALQGDTLRVRYERGYDAPCSLIKDGAACWDRAMKAGHFARAIAAQKPPDCMAPYKASRVSGTKPDDPSMIVYDVDMSITPTGRATVLARGPVGCLPQN